MRMRKKKNLLPRMEACGALLIEDPRRGRWRELLPGAKELRVELGCGKGRFTAETAAAEPDVLLIAVEKVPRRNGGGHGAGRDAGCTTCSLWTATPPFFAPRRGGPHLYQLLRSLAQKQPEKAPPDPRQFPAIIPPGAAHGRRDPLQKATTTSCSSGPWRRSPIRLPAVPGHPGPPRQRPRGGYDGLRGQILSAGRHHQPVRGHHGPLGGPCTAGGVGRSVSPERRTRA